MCYDCGEVGHKKGEGKCRRRVEEINADDKEVGQVAVGSVYTDPLVLCQVQKVEEEGKW